MEQCVYSHVLIHYKLLSFSNLHILCMTRSLVSAVIKKKNVSSSSVVHLFFRFQIGISLCSTSSVSQTFLITGHFLT